MNAGPNRKEISTVKKNCSTFSSSSHRKLRTAREKSTIQRNANLRSSSCQRQKECVLLEGCGCKMDLRWKMGLIAEFMFWMALLGQC
jgi:hypothetical protein